MITLTSPEGRIVAGNPSTPRAKKDDKGLPVFKEGVQVMETFFALAIPKGAETDWKQTIWGQQISTEATKEFPKGEYQIGTFAWKIADGDSRTPNKKMKINADKEGYPGHWVINFSTTLPLANYKMDGGKLHALAQGNTEVKTGDYGRVQFMVKGNGRTDSPGMYLNPLQFCMDRKGIEIVGMDLNPEEAFGAQVAETPAQAAFAAPAPAPEYMAPPPPPPAPTAERTYKVNGADYTASQLRGFGWSDAQISALP